jgi:glucose dehydrogenase
MKISVIARAGSLLALTVVALTIDSMPSGASHGAYGEWRHYSADSGASKYSPLDQIGPGNVDGLQVVWRRPHVDGSLLAAHPGPRLHNNFRSTPIMASGLLYASNGVGLVEAFDPVSGATVWVQKPDRQPLRAGASSRGVAYWEPVAGREAARILSYRGHYLYALDAKTGEPIATFGSGGRVDLDGGRLKTMADSFRWSSAPLVIRDVVVIGAEMVDQDAPLTMKGAPGDVRAFDVRTGKLRWTWRPIPRSGEAGVETWESESWKYTGAANVWSLMSADEQLGYVYLPTSSATSDMYGGHRLGDNLFSSSIVCLDAQTGKRVWHFQTVHHDLFDYDNPAAPILVDITVNGRLIKALAAVSKQSFVFVLDRVSGAPVWPIEERAVPASTVPGERAARTQPFPTKPPPFDTQGISVDQLIDFTPELRSEAIEIVDRYVIGPMFTPPSVAGPGDLDKQGTIQVPGSVGGAGWTGAAFDPETGILYVPSMTSPFVANLLPGDPQRTSLRYGAWTRELIEGPRGLPLLKPPYGRVTAIDLNRGEHVWMVPNGDGPRDHPAIKHLKLGPLGQSVRATALVTKTLLFVTEGDQINLRTPQHGGGRKVRALDKRTGRTLWEAQLEAGATGAPMTYQHRGKQYVVFAIGSDEHPAEFVALALRQAP